MPNEKFSEWLAGKTRITPTSITTHFHLQCGFYQEILQRDLQALKMNTWRPNGLFREISGGYPEFVWISLAFDHHRANLFIEICQATLKRQIIVLARDLPGYPDTQLCKADRMNTANAEICEGILGKLGQISL